MSVLRYAGETVEIARIYRRSGLEGELVDATGRRTMKYGVVLDPLPEAEEYFTGSDWNPETSADAAPSSMELLYTVRVWDMEARAVVDVRYPSFGLLTVAGAPLGEASATQADGDAPSPKLAEAIAAERIVT